MSEQGRRFGDRRGVAIGFVALLLFVFLGLTALSIDLGMLLAARTEAQRVVDASALAGAVALYESGGQEAQARNVAIDYAAQNDIRRTGAVVLPEDVDVELSDWLVRVRVFRTQARGTPMINLFARALGILTSDVSAVGAARMSPAIGTNCLLPFVFPDRWWMNGPGGPFPGIDDVYDPDRGDAYQPRARYDRDGNVTGGPYDPYSSYDEAARGSSILLKTGNPSGTWGPAVYFPIRFPGMSPGGDAYRERIRSCVDPGTVWYPGMMVDPEPGNMIGPTSQGFRDLIALAPNHEWRSTGVDVPTGGCVWDPDKQGGAGCLSDWSSPRARVVAMFDPTAFIANPSDQFRITTFAGVFVERVQGNDVFIRFVEYRGARAVSPGSGTPEVGLGRILQLVE